MNTLIYKDYQRRFEYDFDADIPHGEILHLNDVVTFQGRSIDDKTGSVGFDRRLSTL